MVQPLVAEALSYYEAVIPHIAASFRGIPVAWNTFAAASAPPTWRGPLAEHAHRLPTVAVTGASGRTHPYLALESFTLEWLAKDLAAAEFHSWTPTAEDPAAVHFARILLEPTGAAPGAMRTAALLLRDLLDARHLTAIPLLDGLGGIALYLPFSDAPAYAPVRAWLHTLANDAAAAHPNNFTTEPNSVGGSRVHVHVKSNAPGLHSALPYSLRGADGRYAVAPVTWAELETLAPHALRYEAAQVLASLRERGDCFAAQCASIPPQRFADIAHHSVPPVMVPATQPRGHVIRAALAILADGRSRDAKAILDEAIARGLLTAATSDKYVYNALNDYIQRRKAHDRSAAILQNADRTFRMNEPLDDWPSVELPQPLAPDAATTALIARLHSTVSGADPDAWEVAVCDAFAHLGFRATHLGGNKAPDGTLDAQLGPLGYRAMLECKHGAGVVTQPDAAEAAKWSDQYGARYRTLVGPGFSEEVELHDELLAHAVSAWTIDDLVTALTERLNPLELEPCFAPGFAGDAMLDVLWDRDHGERKRVAYAARVIADEGWNAQAAAATQADPPNAAHLTLDAAMLLVQQHLTRAGATRACTREEIVAAFTHLRDPVLARAVIAGDALVILAP